MPINKNTSTYKNNKTTKPNTSSTTKFHKTESSNQKYETAYKSNLIETNEDSDDVQNKTMRKAGRTVLVKTISGNSIDSSVFDSLVGIISHSETKTSNSYFLTFDNTTNSLNAYNKLKLDSSDYKVKFSYYRVFFTINGLTDSTEYNQVKHDISTFVTDKTNSTVLYCKLYRKDNKYIGCGDFTIDTIDGMNILLSKDVGIKEFTIGDLSGVFYRYNSKKEKSDQILNAV